MGSLESINSLQYLRSKTNVDYDSLNTKLCKELGPFVDCTTNQADSCLELCKPEQATTVKESAELAKKLHSSYPDVPLEELAFEIGMVRVALGIVPLIKGDIHIMANPSEAFNQAYVVENAKRLHTLAKYLEPGFDRSRLVIKVSATWEGLQACRILTEESISTLATTTFSFEQAVLAGEAGCRSVSPFIHELRTQLDEKYCDEDPIFAVAARAQRYFERFGYSTRVKACSLISMEETLRLAGIANVTLPLHWLQALNESKKSEAELLSLSVFAEGNVTTSAEERLSFINDEKTYRRAFAAVEEGKAERKMKQAIEDFKEFQVKGEQLFRAELDMGT